MRGDSIVVEEHHIKAAAGIVEIVLPFIEQHRGKYTISIAGESGSGKSETATALADALNASGKPCLILQQDDYFIYPPKSNDHTRRADIGWVGPDHRLHHCPSERGQGVRGPEPLRFRPVHLLLPRCELVTGAVKDSVGWMAMASRLRDRSLLYRGAELLAGGGRRFCLRQPTVGDSGGGLCGLGEV